MTEEHLFNPEVICPEQFDFEIYTDGSGWRDGYGGAAVVINSTPHNIRETVIMGCSYTTVERMEFEALLLGLQSIIQLKKWSDAELAELAKTPPEVFWLSDRESLVLGVRRGENGDSIYARRSAPDLWHRFSFYEQLFSINAFYAGRNQISDQALADQLAGEARALFQENFQMSGCNVV